MCGLKCGGHYRQLQFVVVYKGEKHKKHLGVGGGGKVKLSCLVSDDQTVILADKTQKSLVYNSAPQPSDESKICSLLKLQAGHTYYKSLHEHRDVKGDILYGSGRYETVEAINLKYAPGGELASVKDISFNLAVQIMLELAKAVNEMHKNGVLHCDIKPENIKVYISSDLRVNLVDFGTALMAREDGTATAGTRGTPGFTAPETDPSGVMGDFSAATDVFSLGKTFDKLLSAVKSTELNTDIDTKSMLSGLIQTMTSDKSEERSKLDTIILNLSEIQKRFKKQELNVGVMDLNEFKLASQEARVKMVDLLQNKNIDEIQFVYTDVITDPLHASCLIRQLEDMLEARNMNIQINAHVTHGDNQFDNLYNERVRVSKERNAQSIYMMKFQPVSYKNLSSQARMFDTFVHSDVRKLSTPLAATQDTPASPPIFSPAQAPTPATMNPVNNADEKQSSNAQSTTLTKNN